MATKSKSKIPYYVAAPKKENALSSALKSQTANVSSAVKPNTTVPKGTSVSPQTKTSIPYYVAAPKKTTSSKIATTTNNLTNNFGVPLRNDMQANGGAGYNRASSLNSQGIVNPDSVQASSSLSGQSVQTNNLGLNASNVPRASVANSSLQPTNAVNLPTQAVGDYSLDIPPIATPLDTQVADEKNKQDTNFQSYLDSIVAPPSSADSYNKALEQSGKIQAQQVVNDLTGKLNGIVAQGQANQLSLVGQGRGIPEAIIGGQQAQIGRETAIAALPVQAQLSAAQGNLEMANENLNTLFKIYSEDATNRYNYKTKVNEAIYQYADKKSQTRLTELQKQQDRAYAEQKDNINTMNDWAKMALATGQKSLFTKITNVNPNSPTFRQDLAKLQVQIVTAMKSPEAPVIKSINGVDMQWDSKTGQWITPSGSGTAGTPGAVDKIQQSKDQLQFLRDTAKQATDLADASGPSWITKTLGDTFVGDTNFRQLEALTNTLKTNMLTLATDPNIKKFFGPQMSNADVLLMTSAGTTINPQANSPKTLKAEIQRLDNLFNRMQTAINNGGAFGGNIITAPDGTQVIITD